MTPPPAATHAADRSLEFAPRKRARPVVGTAAVPLLERRAWSRLRLVVDIVVLYTAASAALFAAPMPDGSADRWLAAAFPVIVLLAMQARRGPDQRLYGSLVDTTAYLLGITSLAAMLTIAMASVVGSLHPIDLALRLWLFGFVYVSVARLVLLSIRRHALRTGAFATPTLVVGAGLVGEQLVRRLAAETRYGLRPVGFVDANPLPRTDQAEPLPVPVLGGIDNIAEVIHQTAARHVIVAFSSDPDHQLVERLRECERMGVEVSLVPRLYESLSDRATLDHLGGVPLITLHTVNPKGWQFAIKHTIDRVVSGLALVALAPLLLAIAVGVRVSSPGPVLFRQRRVGRDGREFDLLKFRTMRVAEDTSSFDLPEGSAPGGVEGDDRRTLIGRHLRGTSLDELPQFLNVLKGEMSLVGPRPERPEYVERFAAELNRYDDRHRVKSGITGWAQANGLRGQTSIADRVEWDNHYIQNWSLRFDLRIAVLTVAEILRFRDSA
jgi:exopolysaccharide biosynthesis polyprenyl glycosylphosphotransferase